MSDCFNRGNKIGNYTCTGMGNCNCGSAYNCYCKGNMGDCNCDTATNCYAIGNLGNLNAMCTEKLVFCGSDMYDCNCGSAKDCYCADYGGSYMGTVNYNSKKTDLHCNMFYSDELHDNVNGGSDCLNAGAIAGIVLGTLAAFGLCIGSIYWCRKRSSSSTVPENGGISVVYTGSGEYVQPHPVTAFAVAAPAHMVMPMNGAVGGGGYPGGGIQMMQPMQPIQMQPVQSNYGAPIPTYNIQQTQYGGVPTNYGTPMPDYNLQHQQPQGGPFAPGGGAYPVAVPHQQQQQQPFISNLQQPAYQPVSNYPTY